MAIALRKYLIKMERIINIIAMKKFSEKILLGMSLEYRSFTSDDQMKEQDETIA